MSALSETQRIEPGVRIVKTDTGFDPDTFWKLGPEGIERTYLVVQYHWPTPGVTLGWNNTYIERRVFDVTDAPKSLVPHVLARLCYEFPQPAQPEYVVPPVSDKHGYQPGELQQTVENAIERCTAVEWMSAAAREQIAANILAALELVHPYVSDCDAMLNEVQRITTRFAQVHHHHAGFEVVVDGMGVVGNGKSMADALRDALSNLGATGTDAL